MNRKTPFFIAELSGNHNGSLQKAKELIHAAAESGASAIKLQTYKPETMTLDLDFFSIGRDHPLWGGRKLFDLYEEAMTPWEWHEELFNLARQLGVIPFSSPFDRSAVDFLAGLDCALYKVASLETSDVDLIEYIASLNRPVLMSTGCSSLSEIDLAVETLLQKSLIDITLLLCTSSYPAHPRDSHLKRMHTLASRYGLKIGLSDHTLGIGVALAAIGLGAEVIEKHLTIRRSDGGPDSKFSLEPAEFHMLVREGTDAFQALGNSVWESLPSEEYSRKLRRSLYFTKDVKRGEVATRENVAALRPNGGGPIYNFSKILGEKFVADFHKGEPATIDCVNSTTSSSIIE